MPSFNRNRPLFQGVTTSTHHSQINRLTHQVLHLEQSTIAMRENLANNNNSQCDGSYIISDENETDLVLQSFEKSRADLKQNIEAVLKSNAELKSDMKACLEDSTAWSVAFEEDSKRIDIELEIVLASGDHGKDAELKITKAVKNWWGIIGMNIILHVCIRQYTRF